MLVTSMVTLIFYTIWNSSFNLHHLFLFLYRIGLFFFLIRNFLWNCLDCFLRIDWYNLTSMEYSNVTLTFKIPTYYVSLCILTFEFLHKNIKIYICINILMLINILCICYYYHHFCIYYLQFLVILIIILCVVYVVWKGNPLNNLFTHHEKKLKSL